MQAVSTPMESAASSMKDSLKEEAGNLLVRRIRKELYRRLPKFLHPLIPGHRDSFASAAKKGLSRWFWGLVGSIVFTLIFFVAVGAVLLFSALAVGWAVFMG